MTCQLNCHLLKPPFTSKSRLILLHDVSGDKGKRAAINLNGKSENISCLQVHCHLLLTSQYFCEKAAFQKKYSS